MSRRIFVGVAALLSVAACSSDDGGSSDGPSESAAQEPAEQAVVDEGPADEPSIDSTEPADPEPADTAPADPEPADPTEPAADAEAAEDRPITDSGIDSFDDPLRALTIGGLVGIGYTEEEATCVYESVDLTDPNGPVESQPQFFTVLADCGMSPERIQELTDPSG